MNRWELHVLNWSNCQRCSYSQRRKRVVLGKGDLPCDILFVAEGPGDSEDVLGEPMVAQAGRLMDRIVKSSGADKFLISFTNLVGCIPLALDEESGRWEKEKEPDYDCVMACKPRLEEWIEFANPKLIVTIGKPAKEWFEQGNRDSIKLPKGGSAFGDTPIGFVEIIHPASILRAPFVQRGMMVQQQVVRIRIGIRDYLTRSTSGTAKTEGREGRQAITFRSESSDNESEVKTGGGNTVNGQGNTHGGGLQKVRSPKSHKTRS